MTAFQRICLLNDNSTSFNSTEPETHSTGESTVTGLPQRAFPKAIKGLLSVVLALIAVTMVVTVFSGILLLFEDGHIFEVRLPAHSGTSLALSTGNPEILDPVLQKLRGEINFNTSRSSYQWASVVPRLLPLTIAFVVLGLLRQVCTSLEDQEPFCSKNVKRIRLMGLAIVMGALAHLGVAIALLRFIRSNLSLEGGQLYVAPGQMIDYSALFLGLVILGLAEVFEYGRGLREDQELTV